MEATAKQAMVLGQACCWCCCFCDYDCIINADWATELHYRLSHIVSGDAAAGAAVVGQECRRCGAVPLDVTSWRA